MSMGTSSDGIFGDETIRLLRERWPNATMLAEELFAIFVSTNPINIPAGSTIQPAPTPTTPLLNVPGYTEGSPIFSFTGAGGEPIGTISIDDGEITYTSAGGGGGGAPKKTQTPPATSCMPGQIVSGTGAAYQVNTYPKGLSGPAVQVAVTQLQIDPSQTIPAGTWTLVSQTSDGSYWMQVPVWSS